LLAFVFFADGTYVHLEVDEEAPIDVSGETSGMEWGTYSRNSETGLLTVTQIFDNNSDTGLTDIVPYFAQVSGDVLTLQFDNNQNGTIDTDESLDFSRSPSNNLLGVWTTSLTDDDLLAFVFFADGTYVHLEVDEEAPIDVSGETSGMEWGTYSRNSETGLLTVTQIFDNNSDTGLTDIVPYFAQVSGDVLTLQFDNNQNGTIDTDESLDFQRK
jgi:frataxin-like iron-binding protein CyaY